MLIRNAARAFALCLLAGCAAFGQSQYVLQLPGSAATTGQFFPYLAAGLSPVTASGPTGPVGLSQVLPAPGGAKFYLLGTPAANMLQTADPTFTTFQSVKNLGAEIVKAVALTPDGKLLLVATDASKLYMINTANDTVDQAASVTLPGFTDYTSTQSPCATCWITVSRDSSTAYVLTNFAGASQVTKVNLATRQKVGTFLSLTGDATSITLSPLGLLYVTAANRIFEVNPATLAVTTAGEIQLSFEPGRLRFTPDGTIAYAANRTPTIGGRSILQLTVASHSVTYWSAATSQADAPLIDDIFVASNSAAFAISSAQQTLYDVTPTPLTVAPSTLGTLSGQSLITSAAQAAAISDELPTARFLYVLVNNGTAEYIYAVDLTTHNVTVSVAAGLTTGILRFADIPPQTGAAGFLQFNDNQTLAAGAESAPLIVRAYDGTGRPVFNVPVTFTPDAASGFVMTPVTQNTNADGYAQATVKVPVPAPAPGAYAVTVSAGGALVTFTVNIPGAGGGGGGGGGGGSFNQVTIVSGDGQLVSTAATRTNPFDPLTVRVTDTAGNPLPNVSISFSVTAGVGGFGGAQNADGSYSTFTDADGLATTDFTCAALPLGVSTPFGICKISTTSQFNSVTFTVVEVQSLGNTAQRQIELDRPTIETSHTITIGQGDTVPNAVQATVYALGSVGVPIPGVGIRLLEPDNVTPSKVAACTASSTLSDDGGVAHCDVKALTCQAANTLPQNFPVTFDVGGGSSQFSGTIVITPGTSTKLNKSSDNSTSGDGQSGTAGTKLARPLVAVVTDGCNSPVKDVTVTWTILSGPGTLADTVSKSDGQGRVTTNVMLGPSPGAVRVQASLNGSSFVYTVVSTVSITGVSVVTGNNQTAIVGQPFQPVTFVVKGSDGNPIPGTLVTFSVTSGSAGVNPGSQQTNAQGTVSVVVTSSAEGTIVITASAGPSSGTATLTAIPKGPVITAASFVNADSLAPGLVPCGRAMVTGPGLVPNVQGVLSGVAPLSPLPYVLGGLSLTVNGIAAPLESVSNSNGVQSATFQVPCEVPAGTATVVAQSSAATTTVTGVTVMQAQPGVHSYAGPGGKQYGYVICSNGTITPSNFAKRGDTCFVIVTGLGQTTPAAATNSPGSAGQNVNVQVIVGLNNAGVPVVSAQYLPGWNGFYIVGFTVPNDTATGTDRPLAVAVILSNGTPVYGQPVFLPGVQ